MPFINNIGIGGTMNADHIYYNLAISNYTNSVTPTEAYNPTILYTVGTYVTYQNNYYYCSTSPTNPPPIPNANPAYWTQITYNSSYPTWSSQTYPFGTRVNVALETTYSYELTNITPVPTNTDSWDLVYLKNFNHQPLYDPATQYGQDVWVEYNGLLYKSLYTYVTPGLPSGTPWWWTPITYDALLPNWVSQNYAYLTEVNVVGDILNSYRLTNVTPLPTNTGFWTVGVNYTLPTAVLSYKDTTGSSLPVVFDQNRASAYLRNPSEYFLSVQRFTIDNTSTPLFIPQPILGNNSTSNTIYSICIIAYGTNNPTSTTIQWVPEDLTIPAPPTPIQQNDLQNPYYYCYSYEYFINLINNAIATLGLTNSISISFDSGTGLFTIQADVASFRTDIYGFTIGTAATKYQFFMNTALYNLFASFNSVYWGGQGGTLLTNTVAAGTGLDYQILFTTNPGVSFTYGYNTNLVTNTYVSPNINTVYTVQNYNSLPLWSPIKSIVITASKLNVVSEMVATPVVYQNGININAGKQNTDILPTLLEFSSNLTKGTEYKPSIYYEPTGEYRLTVLYSDVRTDALQFQVFWKDSFGNLNPFLLSLGSSATMKLLFRKKSFNSDKL
jgi:hypothetical protein